MRLLAVAGVSLAAAAALFAWTFTASPLPAPAPFVGALPPASPPAGMAVYRLPTGVTHRSAGFAFRGGSLFERRDFAMAAVLVRHPRGDLLVDTGLGREIDAQVRAMPSWFRAVTPYARGRSAAEQLDAAGYDRASLRAILLTHAHWDHVSGIPEFPGKPVWVTGEERRFVAEGGWITAVARSFAGARYEEYGFEGGPYLGFARSHDVHGDGAVVVVPLPGHTPGSVVVFLALPDGRRYALLGDLVWQREGITLREERPWLQRRLADFDADAVRDGILRVSALAARFPGLVLVPAHDARGFAQMPPLPAALDASPRERPRAGSPGARTPPRSASRLRRASARPGSRASARSNAARAASVRPRRASATPRLLQVPASPGASSAARSRCRAASASRPWASSTAPRLACATA